MNWKRFTDREFLLAVAVFGLGITHAVAPEAIPSIPWEATAAPLAFIFGRIGQKIIQDYVHWVTPEGK